MRKVPLSRIAPEMRLARTIYHENSMLLIAGTNRLTRFVPWLKNYGITSIYIDDNLSEDIEIPDAVSAETRFKCKDALHGLIQSIKKEGSFDVGCITNTVDILLDDIINRPDMLISLNDIGTTDDSTLVHSVNTTILALLLGMRLNLSKMMLQKLAEGTLLHDIGKTILDTKILYKPGKLLPSELEHVRLHTRLGYEVLKCNPSLSELPRLISLQHHERLDGTGYPDHLVGDKIHIFSKIVAISDMFDALTSERCYHNALSNQAAINILMKDSMTKLDPSLLALFIQNIAIYPNGSIVYLSDGTHGIVKAQNNAMPHRPIVRVIDDREGVGNVKKLYDVDLLKTLNLTILEEEVKEEGIG